MLRIWAYRLNFLVRFKEKASSLQVKRVSSLLDIFN